ncbi:MAG: hypothetical protein HC880_19475 [Bacteroidia bacterium]|nr:hypothetical protein [Bacteroidia bacterium]
MAQGDYVSFLDSDDRLYPHYLQEASELIARYQNPVFFHLAYEVKTEGGKVLHQADRRRGNLNKKLLSGNILSCLGVFVRRDVIRQNLFNEDRALAGSEDWELWMRLASRYSIHYSNRICAAIIQHDERSVLKVDEAQLSQRLNRAYQYLMEDEAFMQKFGKYCHRVRAHLLLYLSLHLGLAGKKKASLQYAGQALVKHPPVFFNKKFIVILLKLLKASF